MMSEIEVKEENVKNEDSPEVSEDTAEENK